MPRYFIGLDLDPTSKLVIQDWREKRLHGLPDKPVPAENYHLTLSFLGDLTPRQYEMTVAKLQDIAVKSFQCQVSHIGAFIKPQILYLGVNDNPNLLQLAEQCRNINAAVGVKQHHSQYIPHITITRKHKNAVPLTIEAPVLNLKFSQFHLFESVSSHEKGKPPHYPIRETFELIPQFSHKE